jgi:hypothetical protein
MPVKPSVVLGGTGLRVSHRSSSVVRPHGQQDGSQVNGLRKGLRNSSP